MDEEKMKISIIIPVYNVEQYLKKCLNSVINQNLKDVEAIIINDGSNDNSQNIIDQYLIEYPKLFKSITQKNQGQGIARNEGLKHAKGEYIIYLDSDDYLTDNSLEALYKKAKKLNSDMIVFNNRIINEDYKVKETENAVVYNDPKLDLLFGKMGVCNKMYKREFLKKSNVKFRGKFWYEDLDFTTKLILLDPKVSFVDDVVYNYYTRTGSTMNNNNIKRNLEITLAIDEVITYYQDKGEYQKKFLEIEFISIYHSYITTITRVINTNGNKYEKKEVIKTLKEYNNDNFPDFKKNNYMKYLTMNKKIIFKLINLNMYGIIKLIFKIKTKRS